MSGVCSEGVGALRGLEPPCMGQFHLLLLLRAGSGEPQGRAVRRNPPGGWRWCRSVRVCQHGCVELTPKEFQGIVEKPQPVPVNVSRKLRLARWGWWEPAGTCWAPPCSAGTRSARRRGELWQSEPAAPRPGSQQLPPLYLQPVWGKMVFRGICCG